MIAETYMYKYIYMDVSDNDKQLEKAAFGRLSLIPLLRMNESFFYAIYSLSLS